MATGQCREHNGEENISYFGLITFHAETNNTLYKIAIMNIKMDRKKNVPCCSGFKNLRPRHHPLCSMKEGFLSFGIFGTWGFLKNYISKLKQRFACDIGLFLDSNIKNTNKYYNLFLVFYFDALQDCAGFGITL